MCEDPSIFRRWAKAGRSEADFHLLPWHGLDVAAVFEAALDCREDLLRQLADAAGADPTRLRRLLLWLAALHDVGKVGSAFQRQRPDIADRLGIAADGLGEYRREFGHDHLGFLLLCDDPCVNDRVVVRAPSALRRRSGLRLLLAVFTGHHGRQPPAGITLACFRAARQIRSEDTAVAGQLVRRFADLFGIDGPIELDDEGLRRISFVLNGMFTVADWLGSAADFAFVSEPMEPDEYLDRYARPTARRVLERLRPWPFDEPRARPAAGFRDLAPAFRPLPLQQAVDEDFDPSALPPGPILVIVQDATGSGKTEAADLTLQRLVACRRAESAYIALPTMATADSAFERRRRSAGGRGLAGLLFEDPCEPVLAHSRSLRRAWRDYVTRAAGEPGEPPPDDWFTCSSRRALLARLGVGTVDQALLGVLRVRHATVRLAGLLRKVLVVDEVHSFDDYVLTLLEELLRHQARVGGSVVLLSATLADRLRARLVRAFAGGAGWTDVDERLARLPTARLPVLAVLHGGGVLCPDLPEASPRPLRVGFVHTPEDCIRHLVETARQGRCGVWFRNAVDDAVEAFTEIAGACRQLGLPDPLLYHARFLPRDREAVERELLAVAGRDGPPDRRRGRIVVATQAAEQSLDLDFDELVSDLAPVDVLIQRFGRFRRHPRDATGALCDPPDRRPDTRLLLHVPPLEAAPGPQWYRDFLPRAAAVYPDVARLWAGLKQLRRCVETRGAFDPVRDGPATLDRVYRGPEELEEELPEALRACLRTAEGEAWAVRETARRGRLPTERGLLEAWRAEPDLPETDALPTTRLGESHEVLLAVRDGDTVRFLIEEDDPLEDSRLRVPWQPAAPTDGSLLRALAERLRAHLVDRGLPSTVVERDIRRLSFETVLLLEPGGDGWRGVFPGRSRFPVAYDHRRGLHRAG